MLPLPAVAAAVAAAVSNMPAGPAAPAASASATATVRIAHAVVANEKTWERTVPSRRRVIVRRDADGNPTVVHVIEFE